MKRTLILTFLLLVTASVAFAQDQPQVGDIVFWLPNKPDQTAQQAQILRGSQYITIQLDALHLYYTSGFFEHIKSLVVTSSITLDKTISDTQVNKTIKRSGTRGEFVSANDFLAAQIPATQQEITIKAGFRGIGEERFKFIFDILSGTDFKTALNLSDIAKARAGSITGIVQKLLSSPYTSDNPKNILEMERSFSLYPDKNSYRKTALREGYLVVISAQENKSATLNALLELMDSDPNKLKDNFEVRQQVLYWKNGTAWQPLSDNSYVILNIEQTDTIGPNTSSSWNQKYTAAIDTANSYNSTSNLNEVKKQAYSLWQEGNTLINEDQTYLASERVGIKAKAKTDIDGAFLNAMRIAGQTPNAALFKFDSAELPNEYEAVATEYKTKIAKLVGDVTVQVKWEGNTKAEGSVKLINATDQTRRQTVSLNSAGKATFNQVKSGEYILEGDANNGIDRKRVMIDPGRSKELTIDVPAKAKPPR